MTRHDALHAWVEGRHAGVFERNDDIVSFTYDEDMAYPISLSMPRAGGWARKAPARFLDNLLPDDPSMRTVMAISTQSPSVDAFDLLDRADTAGGMVFSRSDEPPRTASVPPAIAEPAVIAGRIAVLRNAPESWWETSSPVRFSLAGSQSKFSLAYQDGNWIWPDWEHPSTHIFKPEGARVPDAEAVEAASMHLSLMCGIPTPRSGIMTFEGQHSYVVERFDRLIDTDGHAIRVHTEDMAQALGIPPERKYSVKAKQILSLLHDTDPSGALSYEWIRRLALNVSISNTDAHAKNYSVYLRPHGVSVSPMYDVITTTYWPWVDRTLPMEVGGARGAKQLTPRHWRKLANDNALDPDTVERIARNTAWLVLEHMDEVYTNLPVHVSDALRRQLVEANKAIQPEPPDGGQYMAGEAHIPAALEDPYLPGPSDGPMLRGR